MLTALAALLLAGSTPPPPAYDALPKASFSWGRQYDRASRSTGRDYRIYVQVPEGAPPKGGWPVVYALDGYAAFPLLATQMMLRDARIGRGIVVAIGYPDDAQWLRRRFVELTFSDPGDPALTKATMQAEGFAGGEAFYHFLVDELRPEIDARFGGDPARQSLIGYSLGGLFGLHVLFAHPNAFETLIIGSPSIWWHDRAVLAGEPDFARAIRAGTAAPRVLITADSWEQGDGNPTLPKSGPERQAAIAAGAKARMVDNARELAERLATITGKPPYEVRFRLIPEAGHAEGAPTSATRGLGFIFER
jgi:predicted alpha/beta superfamily hydrolase